MNGLHCGKVYNAFYGRSGATALPRHIIDMTWSRFFDAYEPMHALVAESDGRLLGLTHYLFIAAPLPLSRIVTYKTCSPTSVRGEKGWARLSSMRSMRAPSSLDRSGSIGKPTRAMRPRCACTTKVAERSGFLVYRKSAVTGLAGVDHPRRDGACRRHVLQHHHALEFAVIDAV